MCEGQAQSRPSQAELLIASTIAEEIIEDMQGILADSDTESTPEPNPEDYPEHEFRVELLDSDIIALSAVFKDSAIESIVEDNNLTALANALSVMAKWNWLATFCPDCRVNCALVEDNGRLRFDGDVTSAQVKNGKVQLNVN